MAATYEILDNIALIKITGDMIPADLRAVMTEMAKDQHFKPGLNILVHDQNSNYRPVSADMDRAADHLEFNLKDLAAKIALVVDKERKFGFGRMLETYCNQRQIDLRVFLDVEKARNWLSENDG